MTNDQPNPYAAATTAPAPQTGRAKAALAGAIVIVVLGIASNVVSGLAPLIIQGSGMSASAFGLVLLPFTILGLLVAIAVIILGAGPLAGPGPKGIAGAAVGIAAASIVTTVFGFVTPLILSIAY